jgi:hypothetical protein
MIRREAGSKIDINVELEKGSQHEGLKETAKVMSASSSAQGSIEWQCMPEQLLDGNILIAWKGKARNCEAKQAGSGKGVVHAIGQDTTRSAFDPMQGRFKVVLPFRRLI